MTYPWKRQTLGRVIHTERHTHKAIYTRSDKKTTYTRSDQLTKQPTYEATNIENVIHVRGYAHGVDVYMGGTDIYTETEGHRHGRTCSRNAHRTYTRRGHTLNVRREIIHMEGIYKLREIHNTHE